MAGAYSGREKTGDFDANMKLLRVYKNGPFLRVLKQCSLCAVGFGF